MKIQHNKIISLIVIAGILLVPTVRALGVGPLRIDITVEKGKETTITKDIAVTNPDTNPIHVTGSVTGSVAQFVTLTPKAFDLPPGPGIKSRNSRPYTYVNVAIVIPRELPEDEYNGEIVFTERPTTGGVLGTAAQLGVRVNLRIGEMAEAVFPTYINAMVVLLAISLLGSLIITYRRKRRRNED